MPAKKKSQITKADRSKSAAKNEKIINDLLLQFAYTLSIAVLTIFVFNARGKYLYGHGAYVATRTAMWILFGLALVLGIVWAVLYKNKNRTGFKTASVYSFITAFVAFWYVGLEKILFGLKISWYTGTYQILKLLFPLIAVAAIAEFAVYFVRYYTLNGKKKK